MTVPAKLQLKLFTTPGAQPVALEAFIPVFHRWVKDHVLAELVLDVANYAHVPKGPGVVLIGHNSDYFIDESEGRRGLLHNRKRGGVAPEARLDDLARRALHAAALLEKEPSLAGKMTFSPKELLVRVNDRLNGPANDEAFAALRPELEVLGRKLFAGPFELTRVGTAKDLLSVRLVSAGETGSLGELLSRVGGPPPPDFS